MLAWAAKLQVWEVGREGLYSEMNENGIPCSCLCAGAARCNDAEMLRYAKETDRLMLG
jgi:hypothetical protein